MGWFKDFTKGISSALFGDDAWFGGMGPHTVGGKSSTAFGGWLNDISGTSSSAKQQLKNQLRLQHDAQEFAKWQMSNSHQLEVQDLQNAGLNPILSANAGASAGVTEGSASTGVAQDPFSMLGAIVSMINSSKQTNAQVENLEHQNENLAETTAKTREEKEILNIEKQYIAPMQDSIIKYNNANTSKARQETLTEIERTALVNAQQFGQKLQNEAQGWDNDKRRAYFSKEMDLYLATLQKELISNGLDGSATYQITNRIMDQIGKVFNVGFNFSHANVSSNANIKSQSLNATVGMFR